jgi:hypothetical protein
MIVVASQCLAMVPLISNSFCHDMPAQDSLLPYARLCLFRNEALMTTPSPQAAARIRPSKMCGCVAGIESVRMDRLRNDVVDMTYVAYATLFDGILSNDRKLLEIHEEALFFLRSVFAPDTDQPIPN